MQIDRDAKLRLGIAPQWPNPVRLTDAHHEHRGERNFPAWMYLRASKVAQSIWHAATEPFDREGAEDVICLIAEHLMDDMSSRRHQQGMCLHANCHSFAATELALYCAVHQPTDDGDFPRPYGFDDSTTVDTYADWLHHDINRTETVTWKKTKSSLLQHTYEITETVAHDGEFTNDPWENDSHTITRSE